MEGILRHLPALLALTLPTTNSFRRIGKGCWTGHQVAWSFGDKETPLRVVANLHSQAWDHFEYKLCDNTANMYLALAGILSAGLSGLKQNLELRASQDEMQQEP
jgi:glutamine synthetase